MSGQSLRLAGRGLLATTAVVLAAACLVLGIAAAWLEPAIAAGLAVALAAASWLGLVRRRAAATPGRWTLVARAAAIAFAGGAVLLAAALLLEPGVGRAWLRWAGDRVRLHDARLLPGFLAAAVALGLGSAALLLARRSGAGSWRWWARLADATALGMAAGLGLEWLLADGAAVAWSVALVVACGLLPCCALWPVLAPAPGQGLGNPRPWLRLAAIPALLALLALGHAISARWLRCPLPGEVPGLTRLAALPEVRHLALGARGDLALLSMPGSGCLARIALQPEPGPVHLVDPGPLRAVRGPHWQVQGELGAVIFAPALDRFLALLEPRALDLQRVDRGALGGDGPAESMLLYISGDGARVTHGLALAGLCRVGALRWDGAQRLLALDCADGAGTRWLDPVARALRKPAGLAAAGTGARAASAPDRDGRPSLQGAGAGARVNFAPGRDGRLRLRDAGSGARLGCLPVGGRISPVAEDRARDLAYFWSECGLFRLER